MTAVTKIGANAGADYYRLSDGDKPVSVRCSLRFPVPPVCLTCRKSDCVHAELVAEYLETSATPTEHAA